MWFFSFSLIVWWIRFSNVAPTLHFFFCFLHQPYILDKPHLVVMTYHFLLLLDWCITKIHKLEDFYIIFLILGLISSFFWFLKGKLRSLILNSFLFCNIPFEAINFHLTQLIYCAFIICRLKIFYFPNYFFFKQGLFRSVLPIFQIFENFLSILLLMISNSILKAQRTCFLLVILCYNNIRFYFLNISCALETSALEFHLFIFV